MGDIATSVDSIRETTGLIGEAVQQQGQATQEISRSVAAAAAGSAEITDGARNLEGIAEHTSDSARNVAASSSELTERANDLTRETSAFMDKIRNADRRSTDREAVSGEAELLADGIRITGQLQNASTGGIALRADSSKLPAKPRQLTLRVAGSPINADMRLVSADDSMVNLAFQNPADGEMAVRWLTDQKRRRSAA
jgi:uncharacterized phage infection (PIP) family protein YhgE